jgi:hypothetical protein
MTVYKFHFRNCRIGKQKPELPERHKWSTFFSQHHKRYGSVGRPTQLDRGHVIELQAAELGLRTARRVRIGSTATMIFTPC